MKDQTKKETPRPSPRDAYVGGGKDDPTPERTSERTPENVGHRPGGADHTYGVRRQRNGVR